MNGKCVRCGFELPVSAKFCPKCGARCLRCSTCGSMLAPSHRFCTACGAPAAGGANPSTHVVGQPFSASLTPTPIVTKTQTKTVKTVAIKRRTVIIAAFALLAAVFVGICIAQVMASAEGHKEYLEEQQTVSEIQQECEPYTEQYNEALDRAAKIFDDYESEYNYADDDRAIAEKWKNVRDVASKYRNEVTECNSIYSLDGVRQSLADTQEAITAINDACDDFEQALQNQ